MCLHDAVSAAIYTKMLWKGVVCPTASADPSWSGGIEGRTRPPDRAAPGDRRCRDDTATPCSADEQGQSSMFGMISLLDAGKKRVHVDVQDRAIAHVLIDTLHNATGQHREWLSRSTERLEQG